MSNRFIEKSRKFETVEQRRRIREAASANDAQQGVRFFVVPTSGVEKLEGASYAQSFDDALNCAKDLSAQHGEAFVILEVRFRATVGTAIGSPMQQLASDRKRSTTVPMFTGGIGKELGVLPPGTAIEGEVLDP